MSEGFGAHSVEGFRVSTLGIRPQSSGTSTLAFAVKLKGSGLRVSDLGFSVQGSMFSVQGL